LPCDTIGEREDNTSGLAILRVQYSNGKTGTLTISCHFVGTPDCVFEGITATMDYEDFWNRDAPVGTPVFLEGNRTTFHFVENRED
jgi:Na+/H+ antiporter NhaB